MASYQKLFENAASENRKLKAELTALKGSSEQWRRFIAENHQSEFLRWMGEQIGIAPKDLDEVIGTRS